MNVYVVTYYTQYEGGGVRCVYINLEAAKEYIAMLNKDATYTYHSITEVPLMDPKEIQ